MKKHKVFKQCYWTELKDIVNILEKRTCCPQILITEMRYYMDCLSMYAFKFQWMLKVLFINYVLHLGGVWGGGYLKRWQKMTQEGAGVSQNKTYDNGNTFLEGGGTIFCEKTLMICLGSHIIGILYVLYGYPEYP